jgi:hypothetical protein
MSNEPAPVVDSPLRAWFSRLGPSGKLLALGGALGVIVVFMPLVSVSVNMGGDFPGAGDEGSPFAAPAMNIHQTAMVVSNWRGALCLFGYVAAIVLAYLLYPAGTLEQKALIWAAVGVGALVALLAFWLLASVLSSSNTDMMGMGSVQASPGFGAFLNVLTAASVAAGAGMKAREEKMI